MVADTAISPVTIEKHGAKPIARALARGLLSRIGSLVPTKANQS
jgi:hypothetical protein